MDHFESVNLKQPITNIRTKNTLLNGSKFL
jgi:hypothetical protein